MHMLRVLLLILLLLGLPYQNQAQIQQPGGGGATPTYGIVCDGVTQTAAAIQAALDTVPVGTKITLPAGVCLLNQTLTITRSLSLEGAGLDQTYLRQTVANIPVLTVSISSVHLTGITFSHSSNPSSGGDGVVVRDPGGGAISAVSLVDVAANYNWRGFVLGCVAYAQMETAWALRNNSHGFEFLYEALGGGIMQWEIFHAISQQNLGAGFYGNNTAGANGIGPWLTQSITFANNAGGTVFHGSPGHPISAIRLTNVNTSTDNVVGMYFNTYAGSHTVVMPSVENVGLNAGIPLGFTGTLSVASNTGNGLEATSNNQYGIMINGGTFWNNSWSGVSLSAPFSQLIGGQTLGNGKALSSEPYKRAGVFIGGDNIVVTGHHFQFAGDGSTQAYIERYPPVTGTVIGFNQYAPGRPAIPMQAPGVPGGPPRSGQVVIAETDNTATITLTPAEPDAAYFVQATANGATPGAAAGALTIVGTIKTAGSFQLVLTAPPGAGKNVVYDWMVHR
jgi:hypothetical protein